MKGLYINGKCFIYNSKDRALCCKKRKYGDFLKECGEVLNKNLDESEKDKLGKIE
jgi:hypothetical protein